MKKYTCTVKAIITETYELSENLEIDAPDEIQAEEDAITAAENIPVDNWLSHPAAHPNMRNVMDIATDFGLETLEEKVVKSF